METQQTLHVLLTIVGLTGAGIIALLCDFLKHRQARLREKNLRLEIRRLKDLRPTAPASNAPEIAPSQPDAVRRGATLDEARLVARDLLSALAAAPSGIHRAVPAPSEKPAVTRKNWDLLLGNASAAVLGEAPVDGGRPFGPVRQRGELIPFESLQAPQETVQLPDGFHRSGAHHHVLESRGSFWGLILSIGVSAGDELLRNACTDYVSALLAPYDYGCQTALGRYIIACPAREGSAPNRFHELTAKLGGFRVPGAAGSPLFSFGGFEAHGDPLCDAVEAAVDRMRQSQETGKTPLLGSSRRRKVV